MSETIRQRPHKLLVPVTLFSFSLLAAWALAQSSTPQLFDEKPYIAPQHLVEIAPGHHLDLHCTGIGSPTVVLEAGYAGDSTAWRFVQPILAKHTRVCSYDRAGERFSDPGPYPRDLEAMSKDLHALVLAAHIAKPFVLAGHSMGGMTALLYADNYPNDLAGLVLLDPGTMYDFSRFSALQDWPQYIQNSSKGFAGLRHCIELASDPSRTEQVLKDCNWRDASFPPQLNATQDKLVERSSFWRSLLSTDLALRATGTDYQGDTKEFFGTVPGIEHALNGISSLDQTELQEHNKLLGALPLLSFRCRKARSTSTRQHGAQRMGYQNQELRRSRKAIHAIQIGAHFGNGAQYATRCTW